MQLRALPVFPLLSVVAVVVGLDAVIIRAFAQPFPHASS
jgi:hypothetical protein